MLVFGDSYVKRMREALYSPDNIWVHKYDHYYFYGISGLKAFQCLEHVESIVRFNPSLVVISVGGNDVSLHRKYPKKTIPESSKYLQRYNDATADIDSVACSCSGD